jgi:hypothetical protein
MLTERIENLQAVIAAQREKGEPIGLDQMETLLRLMADWARYARLLEFSLVPHLARLDPAALPAGVVAFPERRRAPDGYGDCPDGAA